MAFGFPAYHRERVAIHATTGAAGDIVLKTLTALSWQLRQQSPNQLLASTSMGLRSWGERIEIDLLPNNEITITSKCALPTQCFDWGKNRANVRRFLAELQAQG